MEALARYSKKSQGYSLIEVLCALMLMTVAMLGVMHAVVLYTETNMKNMLRDEAVRVTQDVIYGLRTQGFNNVRNAAGITDTTPTGSIAIATKKRLRTTDFRFVTDIALTQKDTQMLSGQAVTSWVFLNKRYTHEVNVLIPSLP